MKNVNTPSELDFVFVVTRENTKEVAEMLRNSGGTILITEAGPLSSFPGAILDVHLSLFGHASIRGPWLNAKRVVEAEKQTGWENDRDYLLRPIPESSGDAEWDTERESFEKMTLGGCFHFQIGFQMVCIRSLEYDRGLILYVPPGRSMKKAFSFALKGFTREVNLWLEREGKAFRFDDGHITEIVNYAVRDLENGEVLKRNVRAGVDADLKFFP